MRELTYYVAVSLDGYIAGPNDEFDAFLVEGDHAALWERYGGTAPTQLAEAAGLSLAQSPFDTVLMGWNTYATGLPNCRTHTGTFGRSCSPAHMRLRPGAREWNSRGRIRRRPSGR